MGRSRLTRALAAGAAAFAVALALIAAVAGIGDDPGPATAEPASSPADIRAGRAVFARMGCGSCHALVSAGSRGQIGPDLAQRLGAHDRESLIAAITNPPKPSGASGLMPANFGERMTAGELDALASFLLAARARGG